MGRPSTVSDDEMFAAVGQALTEHGAASVQAIVDRTGVSVGSLYHRYGSREGLLAQTWIDAVESFQQCFVDALAQSAEAAAVATPRFCRAEPERAVVLACCRRSEFLAVGTPPALKQRIDAINDDAATHLRRFARREKLPKDAVQLALVAIPLGAVRQYLPARAVPASLDEYVRAACRAVLRAARQTR
ncbi:MAG: TetR/AcrR family transcriptional regulator [Pseudomonadota bacterium]